jgi:1L-myo-inositol 1-phosphate cytidylyltransferase
VPTPPVTSPRRGVILAAGFGSRLRGDDDGRLKPLTAVAGIPLIFRALRSLELAGCATIVIVLGYRSDELRRAIAEGYDGRAQVDFVINERFDLANGVSLLAAREHVGDDFVVAMADHVLGDEVMVLARAHTAPANGATLLVDRRIDEVFDLDDATKVRTQGTRLVDIGKQLHTYDCIDIGVFVCTAGLLAALESVLEATGDASLSQGVAQLARTGRMTVLDVGNGFWQDVDTPDMLAHAEACLGAAGSPAKVRATT